jgi:hypothetical protein
MVSHIEHKKTMLVGGGALHAPPALLRVRRRSLTNMRNKVVSN